MAATSAAWARASVSIPSVSAAFQASARYSSAIWRSSCSASMLLELVGNGKLVRVVMRASYHAFVALLRGNDQLVNAVPQIGEISLRVALVDVACQRVPLGQKPGNGGLGRWRAASVKARIGFVAGIERPGQPGAPVLVGLVEVDQCGHLPAPIIGGVAAKRGQHVKTAQNFGKPLHLPLIGGIDRKNGQGGNDHDQREPAQNDSPH